MATRIIDLQLRVDDKGTIKSATQEIKTLDKAINKTADGANKVKRNLEGAAGRAGREGKDIARLTQGMGGLVAVYATVVANIYAISTAFQVLQRNADIASMIKSSGLEEYDN